VFGLGGSLVYMAEKIVLDRSKTIVPGLTTQKLGGTDSPKGRVQQIKRRKEQHRPFVEAETLFRQSKSHLQNPCQAIITIKL